MFFRKTVRIVVKNQNIAVEAKTGANLYQTLVDNNIIPPALCKGSGQCGKCKVHISHESIAKPTKQERLVLAKLNLDAGYRLACQTVIKQDMSIDTSEIINSVIPESSVVVTREAVHTAKSDAEKPSEKPKNSSDLELSPYVVDDSPAEVNTNFPHPVRPKTDSTPLQEIIDSLPESARTELIGQDYKPAKNEAIAENARNSAKATKPAINESNAALDGLLLVISENQCRFFLYSAAIDGVGREGAIEDRDEFDEYMRNGLLPDYIHDILKISDIDRVIILSDEIDDRGEDLCGVAYYYPFDIGSMPCEKITPTPRSKDLTMFLKLIASKGKKRLLISLDKLDHILYMDEDNVVKIPVGTNRVVTNLFSLAVEGENPITELSNDLKKVTTLKEFIAPDSITLSVLFKVARILVENRIVDEDLTIHSRNSLPQGVPLDFLVKIAKEDDENSFYIYRSKEVTLSLRQDVLTALNIARHQIRYAVEYAEANVGAIDAIALSTPVKVQGIVEDLVNLGFIPEKYISATSNTVGGSLVAALRLFHESDVRTYVRKHLGGYVQPK